MAKETKKKETKKKEKKKATLTVKMTFTEGLLGTASANPELHEEYIASKSADKAKMKEELASLPSEELMDKSMTVFSRDPAGDPFLFDYQIKGYLKETIGAMVDFDPIVLQEKPSVKLSKYTYKRYIDKYIFVFPRKIPLRMPEGSTVTTCTRPLRAETMKGERVALATSEEVPKGTELECTIYWRHPKFEECIRDALEYGEWSGIGQWRNSGKGRFVWEELS